MKSLHTLSFVLVIVGALNWGLVGLFDFDLVKTLLGSWPTAVRAVYVLVGAAAVYKLVGCQQCKGMMK
ncbi:hypothetical protein A2631_01550 [Candidatus Daviesbacteria bacterium RIFCSPHIGHO2_01_FULL_44_29]|uniref:DUF378 domain-containing protein n=1 Tax=Candidatus Daviesbacteria bacterium RIFCSPHIGHO2_02_FULL_43_12 TaxID=1797776 RepID=A0A1F5KJV9_9BACT|nr:MAG: hypothetical protein A2631_01550 [Candidatus Daviesbacteria bacterium RIFCSPHIGHO2_01_FULL_44_29]OGE39065.1 MAG: hypothetical protein A3E86_00530 [Candidatus Daviesbacteria bacterium RIFCSPHIGHO2_12_FULL_47_45]OGE41090.1 MAG: hypothetical protein A3D25_00945 [Candidatus Daviesbacteria bacterium RIFCSPHIGHO2_02_FULL_43_12]OGE69289.1 MAG: hypothetical protein A3B55_02685 [Candidatus Daviesbacteria bacterium RIFCSPLOWO2_01_FULL_43_15]